MKQKYIESLNIFNVFNIFSAFSIILWVGTCLDDSYGFLFFVIYCVIWGLINFFKKLLKHRFILSIIALLLMQVILQFFKYQYPNVFQIGSEEFAIFVGVNLFVYIGYCAIKFIIKS